MSPSSTKYEALYKDDPAVCGEPFSEFIDFSASHAAPGLTVLDLGCGQGRDAFIFAARGCKVVGVDTSQTGIAQMISRAIDEGLEIHGVVEDISRYKPTEEFDMINLDRTLHMLPEESDRVAVLKRSAASLKIGGHMLIADERSNMGAIRTSFEHDGRTWEFQEGLKPTFLFAMLRNQRSEQADANQPAAAVDLKSE